MNVTQPEKQFVPITITLETYEEAEAFKLMANVSGKVADAVAKETTSFTITARRRTAIWTALSDLWQTTPFYNLELKKEGN